ncbi:MAG: YciI family protein [Chitinophagaceae bacterium]|nr:YciI family protein [Chitinophagaceae bacterium]
MKLFNSNTYTMPQYLVLAKDEKDENALQRRLSVRPNHLDRMQLEKAKGIFILGGATLDENGAMNGSMLVIETADIQAARNWIREDPYITGKVWGTVEILPFRMANV